jgi:uncharacterized protein (UPF0147 family)
MVAWRLKEQLGSIESQKPNVFNNDDKFQENVKKSLELKDAAVKTMSLVDGKWVQMVREARTWAPLMRLLIGPAYGKEEPAADKASHLTFRWLLGHTPLLFPQLVEQLVDRKFDEMAAMTTGSNGKSSIRHLIDDLTEEVPIEETKGTLKESCCDLEIRDSLRILAAEFKQDHDSKETGTGNIARHFWANHVANKWKGFTFVGLDAVSEMPSQAATIMRKWGVGKKTTSMNNWGVALDNMSVELNELASKPPNNIDHQKAKRIVKELDDKVQQMREMLVPKAAMEALDKAQHAMKAMETIGEIHSNIEEVQTTEQGFDMLKEFVRKAPGNSDNVKAAFQLLVDLSLAENQSQPIRISICETLGNQCFENCEDFAIPRMTSLELLEKFTEAVDSPVDVCKAVCGALPSCVPVLNKGHCEDPAKDEPYMKRAKKALKILRRLAGHINNEVRAAACQALAGFVQSSETEVDSKAASRKVWTRVPWDDDLLRETEKLLTSILKDSDRLISEAFCQTVQKTCGSQLMSPSFVMTTLERLAKHNDESVREAVCAAIPGSGEDRDPVLVMDLLNKLAEDPEPNVRGAVCEACVRAADPERAVEMLGQFKEDKSSIVRKAVCAAAPSCLDQVRAGSAAMDLLYDLAKDPEVDVSVAVCRALPDCSRSRHDVLAGKAFNLLESLAQDSNQPVEVRVALCEALSSCKVPPSDGGSGPRRPSESLTLLERLAEDPNQRVEVPVAVCEALPKVGGSRRAKVKVLQ